MISRFSRKHPWLYKKIKKNYWSYLYKHSKHAHFLYIDTKYGFKIRLNTKDDSVSKYIFLETFEKESLAFIDRFIEPGDIIYDIGANIGYYSLIFSKLVGETGHVHAFEPSFREFAILTENIQLNDFHNIYLNQLAISQQQGIIQMSVQANSAYGAFNTLGQPSHKKIENMTYTQELVRTTSLDLYSSSYVNQNPSIIKIDVEGAEFSVLKGGYELLSKDYSPTLIVELCEATLKGCGTTPSQIIQLLLEYGYLLFSILPDGSLIDFNDNVSLNIVAIKKAFLLRLSTLLK